MKVSELVTLLRRYQVEHGDHEVVDEYGESVSYPECIQGECVLCEKAGG